MWSRGRLRAVRHLQIFLRERNAHRAILGPRHGQRRFTLSPAQSTVQPSILNLPIGESADFEFTPGAAGDFVLEIGRRNAPPEGHAVLRVSPPAR